jgi:hypothetical protein
VFPVAKGWSATPLDFVVVEQHEKGHRRREYRRLTVSSLLAGYSDWPYLAQAFEVVRITQVGQLIVARSATASRVRQHSCSQRGG